MIKKLVITSCTILFIYPSITGVDALFNPNYISKAWFLTPTITSIILFTSLFYWASVKREENWRLSNIPITFNRKITETERLKIKQKCKRRLCYILLKPTCEQGVNFYLGLLLLILVLNVFFRGCTILSHKFLISGEIIEISNVPIIKKELQRSRNFELVRMHLQKNDSGFEFLDVRLLKRSDYAELYNRKSVDLKLKITKFVKSRHSYKLH